jgi:hypothetical protein
MYGFNSFILSIDILSSLITFGYCCAGFAVFLTRRNRNRARILVANGALLGMNIKLVGAFLKTMELQTWNQLALFVTILVLRAVLKKVFKNQKLISTVGSA